MKKDRINTTSIREIKHTFKRFFSLLVMSMLGVGVFVGIKMAAPDMMKSLDEYYDNRNMYDIKVVSTLGLTSSDVDKIKNLKNVSRVYGSYSKDVLVDLKDEELVLKVIGINDNINKIEILDGRRPINDREILVEKAMINKESLKLGDTITIKDSIFKNKKLKIVGIVKSPLYINSETGTLNRGNTNIGAGKINYYTYVNSSNFDIDYFTEIYVNVKGAKKDVTNSNNYNEKIDKVRKEIDRIKTEREALRYSDIYNEANKQIEDSKKEALEKLDSAKVLLDRSKTKLDNGKKELDSSDLKLKSALEELKKNKKTLDNAKEKLDLNKLKLDDAKRQIDDGKAKINDELKNYNITLDDINNTIKYLEDFTIPKEVIINLIPNNLPNYDLVIDGINKIYELGLEEDIKNFIKDPDNKDELISKIPSNTPGYGVIVLSINYISQNRNDFRDFITDDKYIDNIIDTLPNDTPMYDDIINALNYIKENKDKALELIDAIKKINSAEEEYIKGLDLYTKAIEEYDKGYLLYIKYYNEYQDGLSKYNNGLRTYQSSLNLYNSKLKEYYDSKSMFDLKINEALQKLNEIPKATWYIYDRLDDSGYSSFTDDGNSVSNLSKIFPTIFFVVAILISLISMSRMVEDDRSNIGTLKSLGFSNRHIRKKYLLYSGLATIFGGIVGAILGFFLLPRFVWNMYKILFDIPVFEYDYNPINVIIGIIIAIVCICGTTLLTIRKVVKEKPSELMRPKAPANGKRVILERIPFIWNRINFSNKITVRNLFRYKKRVITTITGILGCTALMLSGFGIRDSVIGIPDRQYKDVFNFDEMVYIIGDNSKQSLDDIFSSKDIKRRLDTNVNVSMTASGYSINIFVPYEEKDMKDLVNLKDLKTKKELRLKDNEVIISDKLSQLINKKVKDEIVLKDSNNKEYKFIISGVCENYVSNYVFMNKSTYENNITNYQTNISFIKLDNLKNEEKISKKLLENDNIMSIVSVSQTIKGVNNMLKSLNGVVAILIFLSGALSFVVLYNLSYINITERKREIATLKVLGFTHREVDDYIVKETIILTILGIILGLIFGIFLTNVILDTVEIEMVRFIHHIKVSSFMITSSIVMLFTIIVSIIIHFTLKKIDMIESLKSVE